MQDLGPDIVHYQFAIPAFGLAGLSAVSAGGAALVDTIRGCGSSSPSTRSGESSICSVRSAVASTGPSSRSADAVIVHTSEAREIVVGRCGADPGRVWTTPLGAAPPSAAGLAAATVAEVQARYHLTGHQPGGRPLALCFGYVHRDKGIEVLVAAVARLRSRGELPPGGLDVIVAGAVRPRSGVFRYFERRDHEYERALRSAVEQHGIGDQVRFVGFVASDDVPALFAAARVVVVPYTKVTQSSVLGTATVAGAPVVASDLPGLRENLGEGGLLVTPGNPDALAAALMRIVTDDALDRRLRDEQKRRATETELDVVAEQLLGIYNSVLAAPRHRAEGPLVVG